MRKFIFTYLFSMIIVASIVAPTYVSLTEGSCEISALADFGEEEENQGKESVKDLEVKIYYSYDNSSLHNIDLRKKKRIGFYYKNYTSYYKKLVSPPPELLT